MARTELEKARLRQEINDYEISTSERRREGHINELFENEGAERLFKPITTHLEKLVKLGSKEVEKRGEEREGKVVDEGEVGDEEAEGGEEEEEEEEEVGDEGAVGGEKEKIKLVFGKKRGLPKVEKFKEERIKVVGDNEEFPSGYAGVSDYLVGTTMEDVDEIIRLKKELPTADLTQIAKGVVRKRKDRELAHSQKKAKKNKNLVEEARGATKSGVKQGVKKFFGEGLAGEKITTRQRKRINEIRRYVGSIAGGNTSSEAFDTIERNLITLVEEGVISKRVADIAISKLNYNK